MPARPISSTGLEYIIKLHMHHQMLHALSNVICIVKLYMHLYTLYASLNFIKTKDKIIYQMALHCSRIPLFNALSNLLTDLARSYYNHFIKYTAIDPFLSLFCTGTCDLLSEFIQWTANTLYIFARPRANQHTDHGQAP
jgi:hypothetical protein